MAEESLHMDVWVDRCVGDQAIEGCLAICGPVNNLGAVAGDEKLGVLVENRAAWDTTTGSARHLDLLFEFKVHG